KDFPDDVGAFASRVHPDDLHIAMGAKNGDFKVREQTVLDNEFRMKKKSGEYIWVRARNTIVYSQDEKPLIMAGTIMDITKEKSNQLKFVNEMSPSIESLRKGIQEISQTVDMASAQMTEVANRQKEVTEAANGIERSVKDSKTILNSIEGIASQTNLLSLNASIEAARVGDAGRGFAVVAKNVRELADSTKKTTEHIAEILNGMNDSVSDIQVKVKQIDESVEAEKKEMDVIDATIQQLYASADEIAGMAAELYK
ncbi:MAG: PAS domain-containing protein, partial [Lachnospiraceae bacterium]|nr:PAS domain-containing protein [Lachnospiraceae bacterium]